MTRIHLPALATVDPSKDLGFGLPETGVTPFGWSYYGTWRRCHRLWAFRYGPGAHPPPPPRGGPRGLGTAVHAGLAAHYLAVLGRPTLSAHDAVDEAAARLRLTPAQRDRAINAVYAYLTTYAGETFDPVEVEEIHEITFTEEEGGGPGLGPVPFTTRLDLVLRARRSGTIFVVDHKTGVYPNDKTLKAYSAHGQMQGLVWVGRRVWGAKFGGVLINLIQSDAPYRCTRVPCPPAPRLLKVFPRTIRNTALEIQWWLEAVGPDPFDHDPLSQEDGCRRIYGFCDYMDPCLGTR